MLESIEGKRGLPRTSRLSVARSACSAVRRSINNVETLYWVRDIVEKGAEWFAGQGRNGRKGLRTFSVSGRVKEPGVKLAPAGITVRELIDEYCGGMAEGHTLQGLSAGRRLGRHPAGLDGRHSRSISARSSRMAASSARPRSWCCPTGRHARGGAEPDAVLRGRELRPVHALPRRHREGRQADGAPALGRGAAASSGAGDARRLDLRSRPGGA